MEKKSTRQAYGEALAKLGKEKEYTMIEILQDKKEFTEKKPKNEPNIEY